jgi:hypothetical protein
MGKAKRTTGSLATRRLGKAHGINTNLSQLRSKSMFLWRRIKAKFLIGLILKKGSLFKAYFIISILSECDMYSGIKFSEQIWVMLRT